MNFLIKKITFFLENNEKRFLFLVISWIVILFSINTGFYSLKNLFFNSTNFNNYFLINLVNSLRWILPILVLPFIFKISYKKVNFDLFSLNILLISVFYVIHLLVFERKNHSAFLTFKQTNNEAPIFVGPQFIDNINLLTCYLATVLIYSFVYQNYKNKILILNTIFFAFICFIVLFIFSQVIIDLVKSKNLFLYHNTAFQPNTKLFDQSAPRVTGWSRLLLIIFMLYFLVNELKKFNKKKYFINIILLLFIASLIIFSQSRGSILGYIFLLLFYFVLPKVKLFKKVIIISLFVSIPFGLLAYVDSKKLGLYRNDQNRIQTTYENLFGTKNQEEKRIETNLSKNDYEYSVSSGRIEIWKKSYNHLIQEKKIFGYGPQGDRFLLTLLAKNYSDSVWGNNASNAIIYSCISGGVFGLISILLIYISLFILFLKCLKEILIHKTKDIYLISHFSIFCYIVMRSFFENSFAVFGIDFCILIVSYYFISSRLSKLNKI